MKNNLNIILFILFLNFLSIFNANSSEVFNFDVTEIEILEKGNIFLGKKEVLLQVKMEQQLKHQTLNTIKS